MLQSSYDSARCLTRNEKKSSFRLWTNSKRRKSEAINERQSYNVRRKQSWSDKHKRRRKGKKPLRQQKKRKRPLVGTGEQAARWIMGLIRVIPMVLPRVGLLSKERTNQGQAVIIRNPSLPLRGEQHSHHHRHHRRKTSESGKSPQPRCRDVYVFSTMSFGIFCSMFNNPLPETQWQLYVHCFSQLALF